jgi:hypothetical protein
MKAIIKDERYWGRYPFLIGILFIPRLNVYVAGFLSGMIGSKGDLKQGILGALTAGHALATALKGFHR